MTKRAIIFAALLVAGSTFPQDNRPMHKLGESVEEFVKIQKFDFKSCGGGSLSHRSYRNSEPDFPGVTVNKKERKEIQKRVLCDKLWKAQDGTEISLSGYDLGGNGGDSIARFVGGKLVYFLPAPELRAK